jgi:hypothetical protein
MLNSINNNGSYEHQSEIGLRVQSDLTENCDRHDGVKTLLVAVTARPIFYAFCLAQWEHIGFPFRTTIGWALPMLV